MYCRMCGTRLPGDSNYCTNCGTPTTINPNGINAGREVLPTIFKKGKGWVILILGILSIILLGPLTGIPAGILGYLDLKKMRRSLISARGRLRTKAGMILGIVGTFLIPVFIFTFTYYPHETAIRKLPVTKNRAIQDALIMDCKKIGIEAQGYYRRSIPVYDSLGTFDGWEIPLDQASSAAGSYSILDRSPIQLTLKGVSFDSSQTVFIKILPDTMYTKD